MDTDLSIVSLVLNASIIVQAVLVLLLVVSILSWTMIFQKWRMMKKAARAAEEFEEKFWSGGDLGNFYNQITSGRF